MGGVRGTRQNVLGRAKSFELRDAISALESPLKNWDEAISYFSKAIQFPVTRRNIVGVCEDAKMEVTRVVETYQKRLSNECLQEQIEELKRQVKSLELHVAALIEFRSSLEG
jgi:hypothetical protein